MSMPRQKLVSRQPWKGIYALFAAVITLLKLPFYLIQYSVPSFRQHAKWSFQQALMNKLFRTFLYHASVVEVNTPIHLSPGEIDKRIVAIESVPADKVYGAARDPVIKPSAVEGTWYPSTYESGDENNYNIILHFHGGGYAMCDGREGDSGFASKMLVEHAAAKALFPSYRLSSNHGGRFPAALQDAITSYNYLLELRISPDKIVLSGDSAGGNLALALLRYLAENSQTLPQPSSILLWSPTTDILAAKDPRNIDQNRNSSSDFLAGDFCAWGAKGLIVDVPHTAAPYFSPKDNPFTLKAPIWMQLGGLEVLHDDAIEFAEHMREHGNSVEVYVEPRGNHDIFYLGGSTGFSAEAAKAVKAARVFLEDRKSG
ncbi:MAG: hypothetical protein Q9166_005271 [cf. Caloplaca sp. 2 TL-2023]